MNCTTCQHSKIDLGQSPSSGKLLCRLNPPSAAAVAIPTAQGVAVQVITVWPTVTDSDHCSEHSVFSLRKTEGLF